MSEKAQLAIDAAVAASTATKFTYGCLGVGTLFSWVASINWIPWLSLLLAFLTFFVNWYYKRQEDKRAEEKHNRGKDEIN